MGWMSWNLYGERINEQLIRDIADAMVENGYRDAGYTYIFIDDCWQGGRDKRNFIIPDPEKFPSGIKALADYVHSKGLKLGIYSDAAKLTCAGYTASYGFEEQDACTFASWGIDYLKYDYCGAPADAAEAARRYKTMADALSASGRDIVLGICEWGRLGPEKWAAQSGGSVFRTSGDVRDMWRDLIGRGGMGILDIIDITAPILPHQIKGCWLDMDMLVIGLNGTGGPSSYLGGTGCTPDEYRTQMAMWCMFASPLAMTHDLLADDDNAREILQNADLIAINQDVLGLPARRLVNTAEYQVYLRELEGGYYALAVLACGDVPVHLTLYFADLGLSGKYLVRDLWAHKMVGRRPSAKVSVSLPPHATAVYRLSQR
ncbi:MAG: glycoside hydrolase family 27 protein [Bacteroidales bacterium]|nr:glycoside hydrolase family 27 protein [Bacteroidales bacterium]